MKRTEKDLKGIRKGMKRTKKDLKRTRLGEKKVLVNYTTYSRFIFPFMFPSLGSCFL